MLVRLFVRCSFIRAFVDLLVGFLAVSVFVCDIVLTCTRCRVLFISFMFPVSNLNNLNDLHCCLNKLFATPVLPNHYIYVHYVLLLCINTNRTSEQQHTNGNTTNTPEKVDFIWGCRSKYIQSAEK